MTTFAVTNSSDLLPAVNYLLSNLDTGTAGNVTIPGNVLVANTVTGVVSQAGNVTPVAYLYQYVNLRYSNNATGTAGFDTNSNNYSFFGVYNSAGSTPSANPTAYQWFQVSPPFDTATSRTLYYSAIGGRQIQWAAASSPPSTSYLITTANVAIDLDVVTTATGTAGDRGPIALCFVITTADPGTASSAQLTTWFEASRDSLTPPIGTGLTPVVGDTATFTWAAGPGSPTETYSYTGSVWVAAEGQVVSGSVIVADSLPGNTIIASTVTATQIAANTITANNIQTGTLTTNLFTANTISANILQANTFTANTISGQAIIANTFSANTINGNSITSASISADKLEANVLVANTVISTGATIGNFASPGFWLQGNTGNARFGNTVSIGNNLTVGNNAQIGGNLAVTGLISAGSLNANTVGTTTVVPLSISSGAGITSLVTQFNSPAVAGTIYNSNLQLTFTTTLTNQPNFVFAQALIGVNFAIIVNNVTVSIFTDLVRQNVATGVIESLFPQNLDVYGVTALNGATAFFNLSWTGVSDVVPAPGTYRYFFRAQYGKQGPTSGGVTLYFMNRNVMVQTLKR